MPLSKIERIAYTSSDKHGQPKYHVCMDGGGRWELSGFAYTRIASTPLQFVPANPSIEALIGDVDGDEPHVSRSPVIAWAKCFDSPVRIVTPVGVGDGHRWKEGQGYALMPDSSAHSVGQYLDVIRFDDLHAYFAYEVDQHRVSAEARKLTEIRS